MSLLNARARIDDREWLPYAKPLVFWIIGMLGLLVASSVSMMIGLFNPTLLGISTLCLVVVFYFLRVIFYPGYHELPKVKHLATVVLGLFVGIVFVAFVRSFSPYPQVPGSDTFTHLYVIKGILNTFSTASSPLLYQPSIHVIIALGIGSFGASSEGVLWSGVFVTFLLYSTSTFILAWEISKSWGAAILCSIFSLAFTEQGLTPNLPVFYPSSIVMSIFPLCLLIIYRWAQCESLVGKKHVVQFGIICTGLVCIHFQLGIIASMILFVFLSLKSIVCTSKWTKLVRIITLLLGLIVILYYLQIVSYQFNLEFLGTDYVYLPSTKVMHVNNWFSPALFFISLVGIVILAFAVKNNVTFGLITGILLFTYFQKIPNIHRIMSLVNPLLGITASSAIMMPFLLLNNMHLELKMLSQFTGKIRLRASNLRIADRYHLIYVVIVFIALFPSVTSPYNLYIDYYVDKGFGFYDFTEEELDVGRWIFQNTPSDLIIYSDPATILAMRGLAFRRHVEAVAWNKTVGELIKTVMMNENATEARKNIISTVGEKVIIVITPRTSRWIRNWPNEYLVFLPVKEFVPFTGLEKFFDETHFLLKYKTANILVFLLRLT